MSWNDLLSTFLPAFFGLFGIVVGALVAVITVGHTEKRKEIAIRTVKAYAELVQYVAQPALAWEFEVQRQDRQKSRCLFALFAGARTLSDFAAYRRCVLQSPKRTALACPTEWAKVVRSMRGDIGTASVKVGTIEDAIR